MGEQDSFRRWCWNGLHPQSQMTFYKNENTSYKYWLTTFNKRKVLQTLLDANTLQQRQMDILQKEINDIKQRTATSDSTFGATTPSNDAPTEDVIPQHRPMGIHFIPQNSIAEANKRHFTGTKFHSKTQDVLEWTDYSRGYVITRTFLPDFERMCGCECWEKNW